MLVNGRSHLALLNGPVVAERRGAPASLRSVGRWFRRKFFGEALHPAPRPPHDLGVLVGHVVLLLGVAPQVVKGGQCIGRSGAIAGSRSPPPRLCASSRVAPQPCPDATALRMRGKFLSARQRIGLLPPVCSETGPRPPIRAARSCKRDRRGCSPGHAPTQWAQAKISPGFSKRKSHQTSQAMKGRSWKEKSGVQFGRPVLESCDRGSETLARSPCAGGPSTVVFGDYESYSTL
jgi:hypothetical protein